ncbi:hypothetical protein [Nitrosomonas sp. Nm58]|uniref:hypothetical protein n=1 Tax=Nitrosomonas sp. Nm58 TaxID=200126 RepID=UPI0008996772|nr:hypothetical protein [Nitrosomonas sp. Nm58]SDY39388.1 hypothetical protein SAMN05421754_100880 [Nitrosomonas sp. Nm58]
MSRTIDTYNPQLKVVLHKTVGRGTVDGNEAVSTRFSNSDTQIDLSPVLGDGSSVLTSKSVRDPAGGFTVTLIDRQYEKMGSFESLYGLIEPMDVIEIRMKHEHDDTTKIPIVMRGFISEIRRTESMGADGKPQRNVVLVGQDYGKIWQMLQILFLPGYVIGQNLITNFKLFERYKMGFETNYPSDKFIRDVFEKIINPYLKGLMPEGSSNPAEFKLDRIVDDGSRTSISGTQNQEGTLYNLMRMYTDVGIWNELFIQDEEDGVHVVFRPTPALKVDGKTKIQERAPDPEIIDVPIDRIINMTVSRSDADIANFYWVRSPRFDLNSDLYRQLFAVHASSDKDTVLLTNHPNTNEGLYGLRAMYGETQTGPNDAYTSGLKEAEEDKRRDKVVDWVKHRRVAMVEQNKDNVVLERGSLRMFGNERIRAGMYINLKRGAFNALYYVTQVDHSFVPYNGFVSTLTLERGLGFVERVKMESGKQSPWIAERTR